MNERIRLLTEQATTEESDGFKYFDKEKFAGLIVRECADIVEDSRIQGDEGVCLVGATKNKIKQQFGVTE